jgi:hypothetical protein
MAKQRPRLADPSGRKEDEPHGQDAVERVEGELERGNDAEVRARAAHRPEEIGVLALVGAHEAAVGRDHLDRAEVVDREAVLALEPAHAAAEGQPANAGVRHDAHGTNEPVCLRRCVKLAEERAAVHARCARLRVHARAAHAREIDDQTAVARPIARRAVPAAADGDQHVRAASEP